MARSSVGDMTWFFVWRMGLLGFVLGGFLGAAFGMLSIGAMVFVDGGPPEALGLAIFGLLFGIIYGAVPGLFVGVVDAMVLLALAAMLATSRGWRRDPASFRWVGGVACALVSGLLTALAFYPMAMDLALFDAESAADLVTFPGIPALLAALSMGFSGWLVMRSFTRDPEKR